MPVPAAALLTAGRAAAPVPPASPRRKPPRVAPPRPRKRPRSPPPLQPVADPIVVALGAHAPTADSINCAIGEEPSREPSLHHPLLAPIPLPSFGIKSEDVKKEEPVADLVAKVEPAPADAFDAGPGMDMTDFAVFDDDVTEFFRDGMDDRAEDNDLSLTNSARDRLPEFDAALSGPSDRRDGLMDVDTEPKPSPRPRIPHITARALAALRKSGQGVPPRPGDAIVGSRVGSFFEDDLTERRIIRLAAVGSLGKRRSRARLHARRTLLAVQTDVAEKAEGGLPGHTSFYNFSLPYEAGADPVEKKPMVDCYVPRRRLKAYGKMRRKGTVAVQGLPPLCEDSESSDESDGDTLPGIEPDMKLPDLAQTALMEAAGKTDSGSDSHKEEDGVELDPIKIFDSVAVDCASACMVLAARHAGLTGPGIGAELGAIDANGSPVLAQGDESGKVTPPVPVKPVAHTMLPKLPGNAQSVSPMARSPSSSKKERELHSLLTLLEMQAFSVKELDLFRDTDVKDKTDRFALHGLDMGGSENCDPVTAATVRRVLMGLPRELETSSVFCNYNAAIREVDSSAQPLTVVGPVPVQDVLGEKAAVFPLSVPRVCVGMNKEWVEAPSGVLPVWEKAGLEPYSVRKDVQYVSVGPKEIETDVRLFLRDVSAAYEECSFGRHSALPFDPLTLITNSKSKDQRHRHKNPELLSDSDKAMSEQYHLAAKGLCTKLGAVTRDHRKGVTDEPRNIVVYIISPFGSSETAANVSLLRAVAPLVSGIPGTVPSVITMLGSSPTGSSLPSAPWRSTHASKSVVSITVRMIPREVVDRKLSGHAEIEGLVDRPLRPQLIKAVSFAVFSSIRSKRIRTSQMDGETSGMLAKTPFMPDDLMSPMTPDIVAESPGGNAPTPVSPKGGTTEESLGSPPTSFASHSAIYIDQSSALSPSYLHEPAVVLSGVGKHMGQAGDSADIVLHLAYTFCESASRYAFAWTDQRGEVLDIATVPISKMAFSASRRKAFWFMWARGQRWKISFVQQVHTTICRLGKMDDGELEDWDWVIGKVLKADSAPSDNRADDLPVHKVLRRFPRLEPSIGDDLADLYTDQPTPATPGVSQPTATGSTGKNGVSMDIKMPNVSSITVSTVCPAEEHLLLEVADRKTDTDKRDYAIVSENGLSKRPGVQASAVLAHFEESGVSAIEVNVLRHYGTEPQGEEMTDDRSPWDGLSVQGIASSIVSNFHALRYVGAPPSWPSERWLTIYPVHVDIVRRFEMHIRHVQNLTSLVSSSRGK